MRSPHAPRWRRLRRSVGLAILALVSLGVSGSVATEAAVIRTAVDLNNGVHFLVVTDPSHPFFGQFGFAKYDVGVFWASGATVSTHPDGSAEVSYLGPGFVDPSAEVDVFLGLHVSSGTKNPVVLDLDVQLATVNGAGTGRLIAGGITYPIATISNVPSPDPAIQSIVTSATAGNWSAVHGLLIPQVQAMVTQAAFETNMQQGVATFGSVVDVVTTGPSARYDMVTWQSADVPIEFTFSVGGQIVSRPSRIELVYMDSQWLISSMDEIGAAPPDEAPPVSAAGPLNGVYVTPAVEVPFTASDDRSGIASVELWWRFRATQTGSWSIYTMGSSGAASPISFEFSAGDGFYEFYTIAVDGVGNREVAPAVADAATQKTAASAWSPGVRVNDDTGSALQLGPDVAVAADDTAHAVWRDGRIDSTRDIFYARLDPASGSWSANERVNDTTVGVQGDAHISVDQVGNAYAIWLDTRNGRGDIYFAKRPAATGIWSTNVRVNTVTTFLEQSEPAIAVSSTGDAIAVWYRRTGTNKYHIYSARLPAGASTWSAEIKITSDQAAPKQSPEVAIGPTGTAYAAWVQPAYLNPDIWFASIAPGATSWSTNIKASDDPGTYAQYEPALGVDGAGNVLLAWSDWRVAPHQFRVRQRSSAGVWGPSLVIAADGAQGPSISVASDGSALATWHDGANTTTPVLRSSDRDPTTGTWSPPAEMNDTGSGSASSSWGELGTSRDVLIWTNGSGADVDIYARTR